MEALSMLQHSVSELKLRVPANCSWTPAEWDEFVGIGRTPMPKLRKLRLANPNLEPCPNLLAQWLPYMTSLTELDIFQSHYDQLSFQNAPASLTSLSAWGPLPGQRDLLRLEHLNGSLLHLTRLRHLLFPRLGGWADSVTPAEDASEDLVRRKHAAEQLPVQLRNDMSKVFVCLSLDRVTLRQVPYPTHGCVAAICPKSRAQYLSEIVATGINDGENLLLPCALAFDQAQPRQLFTELLAAGADPWLKVHDVWPNAIGMVRGNALHFAAAWGIQTSTLALVSIMDVGALVNSSSLATNDPIRNSFGYTPLHYPCEDFRTWKALYDLLVEHRPDILSDRANRTAATPLASTLMLAVADPFKDNGHLVDVWTFILRHNARALDEIQPTLLCPFYKFLSEFVGRSRPIIDDMSWVLDSFFQHWPFCNSLADFGFEDSDFEDPESFALMLAASYIIVPPGTSMTEKFLERLARCQDDFKIVVLSHALRYCFVSISVLDSSAEGDLRRFSDQLIANGADINLSTEAMYGMSTFTAFLESEKVSTILDGDEGLEQFWGDFWMLVALGARPLRCADGSSEVSVINSCAEHFGILRLIQSSSSQDLSKFASWCAGLSLTKDAKRVSAYLPLALASQRS